MLNRILMVAGFLIFLSLNAVQGQKMDNTTLYRILDSVSDSIEGSEGMWQLEYGERVMLVITDERHDRMRIISPVEIVDQVSSIQLEEAMIANFHSALDVRYGISEGILWAAFIHPLKALSEDQVRDALLQVYRASETFGSTYSSSELVFPGGREATKKSGDGKKKM